MPDIGLFGTQLEHHVEVTHYERRQEEKEQSEGPGRSQRDQRIPSTIVTAQEDTMDLSYTPVLAPVRNADLLLRFVLLRSRLTLVRSFTFSITSPF